jgi:ankyrin repeat protein
MSYEGVVRLLLARESNPNIKTKYGWTLLFVTAWKSDVDAVQLLLDAGANVNATSSMLMLPKIVADPAG